MGLSSGGEPLTEALNRLSALSPLDEAKLTHVLGQHRLGPLVAFNLASQQALGHCSQHLQDFLEKQRVLWTNTARLQRLALCQVCQQFESAGIPAVALKGSYLAWHVYAHPSQRPLRDLDILVPEARLADCTKLLQGIGCKVIANTISPGDPIDWANYEVKFLHPLGIIIELHRALWYFAVERGVEDFSLRTDFWDLESRYFCWVEGIRYLSETYRYLHILVHHIYKHHLGVGPLGLHDIRLLSTSPSINCTEVMDELNTMGAPSLDRVARHLVEIYNGAEVEDELVKWMPLIFLTAEQNQFIYRTRRSIRRRVMMWLRIQWLGGTWTSLPGSKGRHLIGALRIARKAPAMVLRPGLQTQLWERLTLALQIPMHNRPELLNSTLLNAANDLREVITKA
ncbi:nucleotidyltransferase family protein [Synechococcus sp. CS-1324]|uniref:nucleotidyltransferase family protein n=1 Tax=Synechococcus sp. CS-1324 TaxID=2847980 RepID=UPI00223AA06D|nr:nucleotidyltransferase family protein [Synechococcus sp. CS-1324]MCT0231178.1 nucleotidyltransferase family protein [Synechococcus sp. CS-1324]